MSTTLIRELRERTSCGIKDCKEALTKCDNDIDKAIEHLRKKGLATAAKKSARGTNAGSIFTYIHAGGQVGVILELNCETDFVANTETFKELGKDLCMQVCAMNPLVVKRDEITEEIIAREKAIYKEQVDKTIAEKEAKNTKGKKGGMTAKAKAGIKEKMLNGKLEKFYRESSLLEQAFIKDEKKNVEEIVKEKIGTIKENISIKQFARFEIGEK